MWVLECHLSVEFACSPHVCVGSLRLPRLLPQSNDMHLGRRQIGTDVWWERGCEHQLDQEDGAAALFASGSSSTLIFQPQSVRLEFHILTGGSKSSWNVHQLLLKCGVWLYQAAWCCNNATSALSFISGSRQMGDCISTNQQAGREA